MSEDNSPARAVIGRTLFALVAFSAAAWWGTRSSETSSRPERGVAVAVSAQPGAEAVADQLASRLAEAGGFRVVPEDIALFVLRLRVLEGGDVSAQLIDAVTATELLAIPPQRSPDDMVAAVREAIRSR